MIARYEHDHPTFDASELDAIDVVAHLIDQRDMSASDLGRVLGNRTLGSKILNRKRQLSKAHIVALSEYFHVSPAVFFKPTASRRLKRSA
jgi:HTH-type transcriptional regulator / antitoxin HigA